MCSPSGGGRCGGGRPSGGGRPGRGRAGLRHRGRPWRGDSRRLAWLAGRRDRARSAERTGGVDDVLLADPSADPGAGHRAKVYPVLGGELAHQRRYVRAIRAGDQRHATVLGRGCGARRVRGFLLRRFPLRPGVGRNLGRGCLRPGLPGSGLRRRGRRGLRVRGLGGPHLGRLLWRDRRRRGLGRRRREPGDRATGLLVPGPAGGGRVSRLLVSGRRVSGRRVSRLLVGGRRGRRLLVSGGILGRGLCGRGLGAVARRCLGRPVGRPRGAVLAVRRGRPGLVRRTACGGTGSRPGGGALLVDHGKLGADRYRLVLSDGDTAQHS